jgi:hypothetical protein
MVAGSIPGEVVGIFYLPNPSSRIITLGSTQPLTEMSTRNLPWGVKRGRHARLITLPPYVNRTEFVVVVVVVVVVVSVVAVVVLVMCF